MKRLLLITVCLTIAALVASPALAKKKKAAGAPPALPAEAIPDECPEAATAEVVKENTLAGCRDKLDNDADGHIDCADQDCEIYAMCLKTAAPAPAPQPQLYSFSTMKQLKQAKHSGKITQAEFHRHWQLLRQSRSRELKQLREDYRDGKLSKHEFKIEANKIKKRYEG